MDDGTFTPLDVADEEPETPYERMLRYWQNERHAPELLPYPTECLGELTAEVSSKQREVDVGSVDLPDGGGDTDLPLEGGGRHRDALGFPTAFLYQMDLDRIRFVIADYHRIRLDKIQRFARSLLMGDDASSALSPAEHQFAERFISLEDALFHDSLLRHLPDALQSPTEEMVGAPGRARPTMERPDPDRHVFCRARQTIIDFLAGEDELPITLEAGAIYFMAYGPLRPLLAADRVELL